MKESLQFQIDVWTAGQRLDEFLAMRLGWLSRIRIANLLTQGACTVNASAAHAGQRIKPGDRVEIMLEESGPTAMAPESVPLEIIYEDEHLLVVVKPAGMLVHPTRGVKRGTLANALAYHLNRSWLEGQVEPSLRAEGQQAQAMNSTLVVRPGIVHRLDRATSGLMVIAKRQRALSVLSRHFHHRLVEKRYLALLHGCVTVDEQLINAPIGRDPEMLPQWGVRSEGKPAETRLLVRERRARLTLAELEPVTGRTNQLRIHCAYLGHPVIGDNWYGTDRGRRLCLHAARLAFHHPADGAWMEFNAPLPAEMQQVLND